jgi:hypothetical protein
VLSELIVVCLRLSPQKHRWKVLTDTSPSAISDYELISLEFLTAAIFKIVVFWALTSCSFVDVY